MPTPHQESRFFSDQLKAAMAGTTRLDGSKWTDRALADAITANGQKVSYHYICSLRTGERRNPRIALVEAISHALGLPVAWFTESDDSSARLLSTDNALDSVELRKLADTMPDLTPEERRSVLNYAIELRNANKATAPEVHLPHQTDHRPAHIDDEDEQLV